MFPLSHTAHTLRRCNVSTLTLHTHSRLLSCTPWFPRDAETWLLPARPHTDVSLLGLTSCNDVTIVAPWKAEGGRQASPTVDVLQGTTFLSSTFLLRWVGRECVSD